MALDANGRRLLVTSGSVRAPIYQVDFSPTPTFFFPILICVCLCAYVCMKTRPSAHNVSGFPYFFNLWQSELTCYWPWSIYWPELQMLIFSHTDYSNLIYRLFNLAQVRGQRNGLRTLPHTAAITTVDWHPTLPIFLTGSADNSVRVTSIL